jgi:membrane fusion protein, multidrug efflux system
MIIRTCARASMLLLVAASLLMLPACHAASVEQVETTAAVPVVVEDAKVDTLQSLITASGTVTPGPGAEQIIVAPAPARIAELPKAEGDTVRQGDLLVRFDIPTLAADVAARRAAVAQAMARLEAATASFNRLSSLLAQKVAAPREVEDAKRVQAEAEADVTQGRSALDAAVALETRAVVRAQFSGIVSKRLHNVGDLVDAAATDVVLKVINPAHLQVVAAVPVGELSRIVPGHEAQVFEPGHDPGQPARVLTRPAQVDSNIATADVRLSFQKPTPLAAGTIVHVEIVGEQHPKALVIPAAAIVTEEGETFVMVVGPDNKAHKYPIAIGLATHKFVEITSGLKAGDHVIVRGQEGLPEGAVVTVQK